MAGDRTLPVLFPDAVLLAVTLLRAQLAEQGSDAVVVATIPEQRPPLFVSIVRTGGSDDTPVTELAQLTFDCWAADDGTAHDLAQQCRAILHTIPWQVQQINGVPVQRVVDVGGPTNLPDPQSEMSRYTFTSQLAVRGT